MGLTRAAVSRAAWLRNCRRRGRDGHDLRLRIGDNGVGIDAEFRWRQFNQSEAKPPLSMERWNANTCLPLPTYRPSPEATSGVEFHRAPRASRETAATSTQKMSALVVVCHVLPPYRREKKR